MEEILENIVALCKKHNAEQVILYGSRAKKTHRERSDIDIAVDGVENFELLEEEIEEIPTLYKIDLLNLKECGNDLLLEDIRQYGCKIYKKV